MNIEIFTQGVANSAKLDEIIHQKLQTVLDRFDSRVERIVVKLEDESGGSEAFDGRCRIDAWLTPSGNIHVSSNGETETATIAAAVRKLEAAIKHDLDRNHRASRIRHQKTKRNFIASLTDEAQQESSDND